MSLLSCTAAMSRPHAEPLVAGNPPMGTESSDLSPGAFAELYSLYSRRLYKTIFAITKHPEDAEDALQETFMRASLAMHSFEGRSSVYSWLTRIAINSALLVLRKRRRTSNEICFSRQADDQTEIASFEVKDSAPNPEQVYDLHQRHVILSRAVGSLGTRLKEPIQMRMENEFSVKEISQRLRISEGAVKARLYRARVQLSATFEGI
jgi:RNA polymerase sigma-70 factor, ECF subfamily